ncbi:type VII secretion protein EccB [Corynebacterium mendelii]|uniref:Type VII secretion protein EccB n=1 Tax=Corynebacterium mendelii TaxID=2765362 RepID=A0A939IX21_9CORY|nr:type VII secretion protein EccB [Corynebacterium mendelii]
MRPPLVTTKAQVTGHAFLMRRVCHGLVFGDIRMVHDPLSSRSRGLSFGLVAVVLGCLGAGAMAVFSPDPDPGDAAIVRTEAGRYLTLIDGVYHPTANLTSARLITGQADDAAPIGSRALGRISQGIPVGIPGAPDLIDGTTPAGIGWSVCHTAAGTLTVADPVDQPTLLERIGLKKSPAAHPDGPRPAGGPSARPSAAAGSAAGRTGHAVDPGMARGEQGPADRAAVAGKEEITVRAEDLPPVLPEGTALVARSAGADWLVTAGKRQRMPDAETPFGQVVRRELSITPLTPRWHAPAAVLNAVGEAPPMALQPDARVLVSPTGGLWLKTPGGLSRLTRLQADIYTGAGVKKQQVPDAYIRALPDAAVDIRLPADTVDIIDPATLRICVTGDKGEVSAGPAVPPTGVELPGELAATRYISPTAGSVSVDTGSGWWVITPYGARHRVPDAATLAVIGVDQPARAPWPVIRLLPEGQPLTKQRALEPEYGFYRARRPEDGD